MTDDPLKAALALLASWGISTPLEERPRGTRSMTEIKLVRDAREAGATWRQIGDCTGYSKSLAWNRWHRFTY